MVHADGTLQRIPTVVLPQALLDGGRVFSLGTAQAGNFKRGSMAPTALRESRPAVRVALRMQKLLNRLTQRAEILLWRGVLLETQRLRCGRCQDGDNNFEVVVS